MDKYDLLEAMGGIRDQYIDEAVDSRQSEAAFREGLSKERAASPDIALVSAGSKSGRKKHSKNRFRRVTRWSTAIAALLCVGILVPNLFPGVSSLFRDVPILGGYFSLVTFSQPDGGDSDSNAVTPNASGDSCVMTMGSGNINAIEAESPEETDQESNDDLREEAAEETAEFIAPDDLAEEKAADAAAPEESAQGKAADAAASEGSAQENVPSMSMVPDHEDEYEASLADDDFSLPSVLSSAKITEEVRSLTESCIIDYEERLSRDTGYGEMNYLYEKVTDSNEWLCISVTAYTFEAEGYQQVRHFVVRKSTGERASLESIFRENVDYVTPISENIIAQMRKEMKEDSYVLYRLDSKGNPEHDFKTIRANQDFYIDESENIVICFDEGEAAPMFMGVREFTIPSEITDPLK